MQLKRLQAEMFREGREISIIVKQMNAVLDTPSCNDGVYRFARSDA